jgi:predicted ribosomally synthesized peptide with nif11-like leader
MSIQEAWRFIQAVRKDEELRAAVSGLVDEPDLDELVRLGAERGFSFTVEELREAHQRDWAARSIRSGPPTPSSP